MPALADRASVLPCWRVGRCGFREKSSRRSIEQHRFLGIQISLQRVNPGRMSPHSFSAGLLHHLVINEPFADVPEVNIASVGFPELSRSNCCYWSWTRQNAGGVAGIGKEMSCLALVKVTVCSACQLGAGRERAC